MEVRGGNNCLGILYCDARAYAKAIIYQFHRGNLNLPGKVKLIVSRNSRLE